MNNSGINIAKEAIESGKKEVLKVHDKIALQVEKSIISIGVGLTTESTPRVAMKMPNGEIVLKPIVSFVLDDMRKEMSDKVLFDNARRAIGKERRDELEERIIYETFGVRSKKENRCGLAFVSSEKKAEFLGMARPLNTGVANSSRMVFVPKEELEEDENKIKIVYTVEAFDLGWYKERETEGV